MRKSKGIVCFYDYAARRIPNVPDDSTLAPWAVVASLPFAPDLVLPSIKHFDEALSLAFDARVSGVGVGVAPGGLY